MKAHSGKSIFLCQVCGWKRVCPPEESGLLELSNDSMSSKKFRCPKCGFAVTPRGFPDPQAEMERKSREERLKSETESWLAESLEMQKKFLKESNGQQADD